MDKIALRKFKIKERDSLNPNKVQALSDIILNRIISLKEYKDTDTLLTFVSCRSEVVTDGLILSALKDGKKVGVPKVEGNIMNFYNIKGLDELESGYFGIREPKQGLPLLDPKGSLMIVPGLAFDLCLNRIGYGKGFYDRYFAAHKDAAYIKCGIAFELQMCEKIEADRFDQPLDMLVTETRIIRS